MNNPYLSIRNSKKIAALAGVFLGFILILMDNQVCTLALPLAANEIGGLEVYSLSSIFGGIGCCAAMPVVGFLCARNPAIKGKLYLLGMTVCAVVCVIAGMAGNMFAIILPRLLLGAGCSVIFGIGYLVIYSLYEGKKLGAVLGLAATFNSLAMVLSPIVMGFVADTLGWRSCYYVSAPLFLIAALLVFYGMKLPKEEERRSAGERGSIDVLGTVANFLLFGGLLSAISLSASYAPLGSVLSTVLLVIGIVGLLLLVIDICKKKEKAVIPSNVLADRNTICFTLDSLLNGMATMAVMFFLPLYAMNVMGKSATEAGLLTTFSGIFGLFLGPFIGRAIAKCGSAKPVLLASFVGNIMLHIILIFVLGPSLPIIALYAIMLLRSLTNVFNTVGQSTGLSVHIEPEKIPYTNSLVQLMNQFGPNLAIAIFTVILMSGPIEQNINTAFSVSIVAGALSIPITLMIRKNAQTKDSVE